MIRFGAILALFGAAVFMLACGESEPEQPILRELAPESALLDLVHVHGLGLNSADGLLYVATHNGLYRIENGEPKLVGDRKWDVMGFTVRGDDDFIGGGHPSANEIRDGKYPPLLGFIESKDAAGNWEILAMKGEADLHALAVGTGIIFAVDATTGRFLASADGKAWEARSQLVASSISVKDDGSVMATTPKGLARSTDEGRSWSLVAAAPALALVASHSELGSWGIDGSGAVYRETSRDTWVNEGSLAGRPQAFVATADRLFAATDRGIFESPDGAAWASLLTD